MSNKDAGKKKNPVRRWFSRFFFGPSKEIEDLMKEEQVQSPMRTVLRNFRENKLAMTGLIIFLMIFLFVMIAPLFVPIDLGFSDSTQSNVAPGYDMMKYPNELKGNVKDIGASATFAVGLSNDGKVYAWGKTKISKTIDIADIPDEVQNANIVQIAVGNDHVVALDDKSNVYVWGNTRLGQADIPSAVEKADDIKEIYAGNQCSAAIMEDGTIKLWGNKNLADIKVQSDYQGQFEKIAFTGFAYIALLKDGSVAYTGRSSNAFSKVPEGLESGVVDIAATDACVAALKEDGTVVVWGNSTKGESVIPEFPSKPVSISGGRYHFTAMMENGDVIGWGGSNMFKETTVPAAVNNAQIANVFVGGYQNYAVDQDGKIYTWGLKGYLMGTDDLGRDIFSRLINGGRMTMTVGAIAVIISTILGIIIGGISGYFGGAVDLILQRITEIISSLPFLPFAMILSSIIGSALSQQQRIYLIMIVLGILSWPSLARLVRAQVLAEREKEFVTAAKAMGVKEMSIVFKHILPNVISVIIVTATLDFATCMLTESSLSFLGFGVTPPQPTWGNMLNGANNSTVIQNYWWRWVFASAILGICTICINMVGDGLREAIDPKSNER